MSLSGIFIFGLIVFMIFLLGILFNSKDFKINEVEGIVNTFLVGLSSDMGKTWYFFDGTIFGKIMTLKYQFRYLFSSTLKEYICEKVDFDAVHSLIKYSNCDGR